MTSFPMSHRGRSHRRDAPIRPVLEFLETRCLFADGISAHPALQLNGNPGVALTDVTVATFEVIDPSGAPGTKWNAHIFWGDGAQSLRVQALPIPDGTFEFRGTHTYSTSGVLTITVQIAVPGSHLPDNNTVTTTARISAPATLQSIAVTPTDPSVGRGLAHQFTATGTYDDQSTRDLTQFATWGSSTPSATITSAGLATAAATGTSTISATLNGITGSTTMTVTPTITGTPGDDQFYLRLTPDQSTLQIWNDSAPVGPPAISLAVNALTACEIGSGAGNDTLTIDVSNGLPAFGITYAAGDGSDTLMLTGANSTQSVTALPGQILVGSVAIPCVGVESIRLDAPSGGVVDLAALTVSTRLALPAGKNLTLRTGALSITGVGVLDLADEDLIVHNGDINAITSVIKSAALTGTNENYTTLAAFLNDRGDAQTPIRQTFGGQEVGLTDVLVKHTWNGDANLDGRVNADDYFQIDSGFISRKPGYYNGDFNYDNAINADDYFQIDSAFIGQSGPLSASNPAIGGQWVGWGSRASGSLSLDRGGDGDAGKGRAVWSDQPAAGSPFAAALRDF